MKREFMQDLPLEVIAKDENGEHRIGDEDTVFCLNIQGFILYLRNSRGFCENPTQETLDRVLKKYLNEVLSDFKQDALWYIKYAMPLFLEEDLKK
jgi:hypothetical protein